MPRIAKPPHRDLPRLRSELQAFLIRTGSNPNSFSKAMGVSQSTVQRFLSGRTKNITGAIRPLLIYAGIEPNICINEHPGDQATPGGQRIKEALEKAWDGSDASAIALAQVIEAIGPFLMQRDGKTSQT